MPIEACQIDGCGHHEFADTGFETYQAIVRFQSFSYVFTQSHTRDALEISRYSQLQVFIQLMGLIGNSFDQVQKKLAEGQRGQQGEVARNFVQLANQLRPAPESRLESILGV